jgi:hypothetical protein
MNSIGAKNIINFTFKYKKIYFYDFLLKIFFNPVMIPLSIKLKNLIVILVGMVKMKPGSTLFFSPVEWV